MYHAMNILPAVTNAEAKVEITFQEEGEPKYIGLEFRPMAVEVEFHEDEPEPGFDIGDTYYFSRTVIEEIVLTFRYPMADQNGHLVTFLTQPRAASDPVLPDPVPLGGKVINGVHFTDEQWATTKRVLLGRRVQS